MTNDSELMLDDPATGVFVWGIVFVIVGVLISGGSFFLPIAPDYSGTVNLSLLQAQVMVLHCGLALLIIGTMMLSTDAIVQAIRRVR